jgi:hypothetical protein
MMECKRRRQNYGLRFQVHSDNWQRLGKVGRIEDDSTSDARDSSLATVECVVACIPPALIYNKCCQFIYVNKDKFGDYIDCPIEMKLLSIAVIVVSAP